MLKYISDDYEDDNKSICWLFCIIMATFLHQQEMKLVLMVAINWCGSLRLAWIKEISLACDTRALSMSPFSKAVMLSISSSTSLSATWR